MSEVNKNDLCSYLPDSAKIQATSALAALLLSLGKENKLIQFLYP